MTDHEVTQYNEPTQGGEQLAKAAGGPVDMMLDAEAFEQAQRVAKLLASSQLVPQHLQGQTADCFLALHMAQRLGEDPLMVCQNIVIISGTAGWRAQWLISRANRLGVFRGRIRFDAEGSGTDLAVTARATLAETGEEVSASASMAMAQAEGWTRNPKYKSMPQQMLSYRAASFLIRLYCPEATLGYQSAEEVEDMQAARVVHEPAGGSTGSAEDRLRQRGEDEPEAPAAPSERKAQFPPHTVGAVDADGMPWDARIHSGNGGKTGDGRWRKRRGISAEYRENVEAELRSSGDDAAEDAAAPAQDEAAGESSDEPVPGEGEAPEVVDTETGEVRREAAPAGDGDADPYGVTEQDATRSWLDEQGSQDPPF